MEKQPSFVFIIGMHRSGTSLIAKLLSIAGADIGDEGDLILRPDQHNAKGYFENQTLWNVNEAILAHVAGAWYAPPDLSNEKAVDPELTKLATAARIDLARRFAKSETVVLKDPRTSILLPIWREAFPDAQYVICVRNPLDVAASLRRRDSYPVELSACLWALYTLASLRDTAANARRIVRYQEVLADPERALLPVFGFLHLPGNINWIAIRQFVEADLSHSAATDDALRAHADVPQSVKDLYACACATNGSEPIDLEEFIAHEVQWRAIVAKYRGLIDQRDLAGTDPAEMAAIRSERDRLRAFYESLIKKPLLWALASIVRRRWQHRQR